MKVISREGNPVEYDSSRIFKAIKKAFNACNQSVDDKVIWKIVNEVPIWDEISVEEIQDQVMEVLRDYGFSNIANEYLIYKHKHSQARQLAESKQEFIRRYKEASNTANATIDDNSNVANKNIGILNAEGHKEENLLVNRAMVANKLKELFPDFPYKSYYQDLNHHIIYKHDESSFMGAVAPYCCSISMYPFLNNGIKGLGGLSNTPKNLDSFCGMFINLMFAISGQFAGAVATPEFLLYLDYFFRKEFGENYISEPSAFYKIGPKFRTLLKKSHYWTNDVEELATHDFGVEELNKIRDEIVYDSQRALTTEELEEYKNTGKVLKLGDGTRTINGQMHQCFQQVVYSINQPASARGMQSCFWNVAYFDKPFFEAMFENFVFPDFTTPNWESLDWLQKEFMQWFNEERLRCLLTFPVKFAA